MHSQSIETSLYHHHLKLNAKMVPYAGFSMPVQYNSVKEEVLAVRRGIGVFDVSHMGEFFIEGKEAMDAINFIFVNEVKSAPPLKAIYTPMCNEKGTVIDDMIVYKISETKALICVNAANIAKDRAHISKLCQNFDCTFTDKSDDYSLLALQGPKMVEIFNRCFRSNISLNKLGYYTLTEGQINGSDVIVARTGYTGEDGVEIFCDNNLVKDLWDTLMQNGVTPCGLASRDVLRLEVCFPLYGHELTEELTPLDSALKWTLKFDKPKFMGKEALLSYAPRYRFVKLSIEKGIPRQGHSILDEHNNEIGVVASGTFSPTLNKGIAMAHIKSGSFPKNDLFKIKIREQNYNCEYHKKPFVAGGHI